MKTEYVVSEGPYNGLYYVTIVDEDGDEIENFDSFDDYEKTIIFADNLSEKRNLEHICEARFV